MASKHKIGVDMEENFKGAVTSAIGSIGAEMKQYWENVIYVEDLQ